MTTETTTAFWLSASGQLRVNGASNFQLQRTSARSPVSLVSRSTRRAEAAELRDVRRHGDMASTQESSKAFAAFAKDVQCTPVTTLRGGEAIDDYREPEPFDPLADAVSDAYLEAHSWGVIYLDPQSWRHYLPYLIDYAYRHIQHGSLVVDALIGSLRPPDRDPPRLRSLTPEQEAVVVELLDVLAFTDDSAHQDLAQQALQEWWAPGALYRRGYDA